MTSVSTEAKVGLFVLVALIILAYMSFQVGESTLGLRKGYRVAAFFDNAAGLQKDASVQIAGVEIGRVESIGLKDGRAIVTMRIRPDVELEKDVIASIKTHGILGDKYIELVPGTRGIGYLSDGGQIVRSERQADIDRLLNNLAGIADDVKGVTTSLNRVLAGDEGEAAVRDIIYNIRELSERLNRVVAQNDDRFTDMMINLREASREMQKTFAQLSEITEGINKGEGTIGSLVKDKSTVEKLNKTLASLQEITDKINQGKGSIGKLVNDEETVKNLNESLTGLNRYVTRAEQLRTFLSFRGEYLPDRSASRGTLELTLQPGEDYFYILGLSNDPKGARTIRESTTGGVTTTTTEYEKNRPLFNAEIGKRWKDLTLRGGLIESTGGMGADYFVDRDKLRLTFEAYDFDPDKSPHLKAYAEYRLFKHLFLSAGWDDFLNKSTSSPLLGVSIRFEDEDLKYMLSSTPIPK